MKYINPNTNDWKIHIVANNKQVHFFFSIEFSYPRIDKFFKDLFSCYLVDADFLLKNVLRCLKWVSRLQ